MSDKRLKFFGWGYEGDQVAQDELRWFEETWSRALGTDKFRASSDSASHANRMGFTTGTACAPTIRTDLIFGRDRVRGFWIERQKKPASVLQRWFNRFPNARIALPTFVLKNNALERYSASIGVKIR
jgi:hypothetical protein